MERITKSGYKFNLLNVLQGLNRYADVDEILNRLASYEDTGLEPEEINAALREKQEREENKPLTLEQLREMVDSDECGVHIWVLKTGSRSAVSALTDVTCPDGVVAIWNANATENFKEKDYGKTWFAYRHKPERSEG